MKILLDTHAFLWLIADAPELSKKAKKIFLDEENDLFLSLASIWEMAIKLSLGKLKLKPPIEKFIPKQLQENSILQLEINFRHVVGVASLPFHHRDPFDRLIISQAIQENLPILSNDVAFDAYDIQRLW
ncbi:MAG: type II toxin-antitoxin system VapC family toxin [Gammaproteobacteria bacterium]|nr:MAG: type II toxin-antitoxin system VapC family toxin [Gammaproteobacteria bacterium]